MKAYVHITMDAILGSYLQFHDVSNVAAVRIFEVRLTTGQHTIYFTELFQLVFQNFLNELEVKGASPPPLV
jgi:hypothetical protein